MRAVVCLPCRVAVTRFASAMNLAKCCCLPSHRHSVTTASKVFKHFCFALSWALMLLLQGQQAALAHLSTRRATMLTRSRSQLRRLGSLLLVSRSAVVCGAHLSSWQPEAGGGRGERLHAGGAPLYTIGGKRYGPCALFCFQFIFTPFLLLLANRARRPPSHCSSARCAAAGL